MKFLTTKFRLIDFIIENVLSSSFFNKKNIFLLTSKKKNNHTLISYVIKKYKINIIQGSEKNVYSRYKFFDDKKNYIILRITADNPLVDPKLIDAFIRYFISSKSDYLTTRAMCHSKRWKVKSDYPKGISLEIFYSKKLFINDKKFNIKNQESPTWFFYNKKFPAKIDKFKSFGYYKKFKKNFSFTIDTQKDLTRLKKFIKKHNCTPGKNNFYKLCKSY